MSHTVRLANFQDPADAEAIFAVRREVFVRDYISGLGDAAHGDKGAHQPKLKRLVDQFARP